MKWVTPCSKKWEFCSILSLIIIYEFFGKKFRPKYENDGDHSIEKCEEDVYAFEARAIIMQKSRSVM